AHADPYADVSGRPTASQSAQRLVVLARALSLGAVDVLARPTLSDWTAETVTHVVAGRLNTSPAGLKPAPDEGAAWQHMLVYPRRWRKFPGGLSGQVQNISRQPDYCECGGAISSQKPTGTMATVLAKAIMITTSEGARHLLRERS